MLSKVLQKARCHCTADHLKSQRRQCLRQHNLDSYGVSQHPCPCVVNVFPVRQFRPTGAAQQNSGSVLTEFLRNCSSQYRPNTGIGWLAVLIECHETRILSIRAFSAMLCAASTFCVVLCLPAGRFGLLGALFELVSALLQLALTRVLLTAAF